MVQRSVKTSMPARVGYKRRDNYVQALPNLRQRSRFTESHTLPAVSSIPGNSCELLLVHHLQQERTFQAVPAANSALWPSKLLPILSLKCMRANGSLDSKARAAPEDHKPSQPQVQEAGIGESLFSNTAPEALATLKSFSSAQAGRRPATGPAELSPSASTGGMEKAH